MKFNFDKHRDVWGPMLTLQLKNWGENVFSHYSILAEHQLVSQQEWGERPNPRLTRNKHTSPHLSQKGIRLHLLKDVPPSYFRVKYFDYAAAEYEMATHSFKKNIVSLAFNELIPFIHENNRIMDCGCGPGYEAIALSMKVPAGEVVAVDLSAEMITVACRNAKYNRVKNMCFYQANVHDLPTVLYNRFDIIFCQLNCSYFEDMRQAAQNFYRALDEQGIVFIVEPFPTIANSSAISASKAANPYFERLYAPEDLHAYFAEAGFTGFYWKEILPGIGVNIISKSLSHAE